MMLQLYRGLTAAAAPFVGLYLRLRRSLAGRQYRSGRRPSHSRRGRFPSRGNDGLDAGNGRAKCGALRLASEDGSSRAWFAVRRFALAAPLSPHNLVERLTSTGLARARCSRAWGLHRAGTRLLLQTVSFIDRAMHFCAVGWLVHNTAGPGIVLRVV